MKYGKSQFKHQTDPVASQELSLLLPSAPKKRHSPPPPSTFLAEHGNDLRQGSKAGCGAVSLLEKISRATY